MERSRVTAAGVPRPRLVDYITVMASTLRLLPALLTLLSCDGGVPPVCDQMCDAAVPLQAQCQADLDVSWTDSPWGSREGFEQGCATWAWEAARLERDATRRGTLDGHSTEDACRQRLVAWTAAEADCATLSEVGWDLPWEDE